MNRVSPPKVVVIGAGIAGAACARALADQGFDVQVVDKARGAGGRLATRRLEWLDGEGNRRMTRFDHGAPAFRADDPAFQQFLRTAFPPDALVQWSPAGPRGKRPSGDIGSQWLPAPDMPSLCRWLLRDFTATWSFPVDRIQKGPLGWQIEAAGATLAGHFDAVVLALPPAQAAPLIAAHRGDWAQSASPVPMQPRWTLMGVARSPVNGGIGDAGQPEDGPLGWVMRNDAKPGRESRPDEAHWVAHARPAWSLEHIEQPAAWVQAQMQAALQDWLGEPILWQHAVVHRWRYAMPPSAAAGASTDAPQRFWWDGALGLGVCGDFFGSTGVEGAWQSAQALFEAMRREAAFTPPASAT
ncbi:NAD(P)/FAD-dependent oxidoreductase [Caenimonas sp. SL110]|uniref:NAD(P)/FAD-dependent oxidoreductase n=1 Tax=Caenimonas sp. SL110 TaxID=1450524 RepID=UPI0006544448|nr:FAD-dependent oxidoreductase [Caenimonas sp. SL110]